jgi:signal transduction histidine kinase
LPALAIAAFDGDQVALSSLDWKFSRYHYEYLLRVRGPDGSILVNTLPDVRLFTEIERADGIAEIDDDLWKMSVFLTSSGREIVVARLDEEADDLLGGIALASILPLTIVFIASVLAPLIVVQRELRPLTRLSNDLAERNPQQLTPVDLENAPRELRPIIDALNDLFQRISSFLTRERQFIDDAAHELRTPLTAIKAQCQAIDPEALDPATRARLDYILDGVDRAAQLSSRLLDQARADRVAEPPSAIATTPIIRRVVADLYPLAEAHEVEIAVTGDEAADLICNPDDLADITRNLVENAIKYGGSQVQIHVEPNRIAVDDAGPGLNVDESNRIFDRFYRSVEVGGTGAGLGLSIARSLATRNNLDISVSRAPELGGARFEIHVS